MSSPALRHRQKVLARQSGAASASKAGHALSAPAPDTQAGQEYAVLLAVLHDQVRQLSDIASHEARQPKKAEFADQYRAWIEGVIEADQPVQDEVLITNMIWAIDYGDFAYVLKLAGFATRHGLKMPERYNRDLACFVAEEIAELAAKTPGSVPHDILVRVQLLTADADMPDPAKAKLFKALGRSWANQAETFDASADNAPAGGAAAYFDQALTTFKRALALDDKSGVKTDIKMIEKKQRDLEEAAAKKD